MDPIRYTARDVARLLGYTDVETAGRELNRWGIEWRRTDTGRRWLHRDDVRRLEEILRVGVKPRTDRPWRPVDRRIGDPIEPRR